MKELVYEGERLLPGYFGYAFVVLSFVGALIALIAYSLQTHATYRQKSTSKGWQKIGRTSFYLHALGVLGIVGVLFFIIQQHYYEYFYVWRHSSDELPLRYMISCFWEGQEGSFLLWTFWHVVLTFIFLRKAGKWEAPAMITIMLAQVMLSSMLLGLPLGEDQFLGLNPFRLLRVEMEAPIFQQANYLSLIEGQGLNPLLQNYWMVIHPPTLFLGFAAAIFPFALVLSGLFTGDYKTWLKPALPWTSFTVGILGAGILMGGIWAYEALSFGGFWAWDPVENAVLVPWIIMVGALHTMVIYKNTGRALLSTVIWVSLSFILILYSTYLTRSGVLGDTSVHSFTADGLMAQLLIFLFSFIGLTFGLIWYRRKAMPKSPGDEAISSREMWMFIGSLVLAIASFQIIFSTSIPVFNKLLNLSFMQSIFGEVNLAPPDDPISHYNQFQIPFAIVITLLTATGQYFKYRKTNMTAWYKKVAVSFGISVLVTALLVWITKTDNALYLLMLLATTYAVVGNVDIMIKSSKIKKQGASLAHIGFGLVMMGALISTSKQEVVSVNHMGYDYGEGYTEKDNGENIYLPLNEPKLMSNYLVTFIGDSVDGPNNYYKVRYEEFDSLTGNKGKSFVLTPNAQINPSMGLMANPSTKRYITSDLYTHVTSVDAGDQKVPYEPIENFKLQKGQSVTYKSYTLTVVGFNRNPEVPAELAPLQQEDSVTIIGLEIDIEKGDLKHRAMPLMIARGGEILRYPYDWKDEEMRLYFTNIDLSNGELEIAVTKKKGPQFIIMKALRFPFINILWLGCIVMVLGSFIVAYQRIKKA